MKVIVCDASPLIFLAKLDHLALIPKVLGGRVFVLQCVVEEILTEKASTVERRRLDTFLEQVEVVAFAQDLPKSSSLSHCDRSTLQWAIEQKADWLVADERLLRRVASEEGIAVIGFIGLLVGAAKNGLFSVADAREAVNSAVSRHGCRISAAVYQRVISELEKLG